MRSNAKQLSKLISYWLRHHPEDGDLVIDDFGWTSTDQLLEALSKRNFTIQLDELVQLSKDFDKIRWEIDLGKNRIRATHGHSIPVILEDKAQSPPAELYHGSHIGAIQSIAEKGLSVMSRQFVHLSATVETAISVGSRHGKPIIIEINTKQLVSDGWVFYQTSDNVWLTTNIPAKYLSFGAWCPVNETNESLLKELSREIGNRKSHFLYHSLQKIKAVWQSGASDDVLFQNQETGECHVVHLTYTKREQEVDGWPHIERFETINEWFAKGLWDDQQYFYDLK
ncbi:MAG TPA: RNA 2'-phosphotransferase [Chitinophagaceae bacterium]